MQTPGLAGVGRVRERWTEPNLWLSSGRPTAVGVLGRGACPWGVQWDVAQGQHGAARPGWGEPTGPHGNLARALAGSQVRVAWAQLLFSSVSGPPCGIWAGIPQGSAEPGPLQRVCKE